MVAKMPTKNVKKYSPEWFQIRQAKARTSAEHVVPMVMEDFSPRRVIDIGCGSGEWLSVFADRGIDHEAMLGIDGDYVNTDHLLIPTERFRPMNLAKPEPVSETFDVAISLEVAEHLPPTSADEFVRFLTSLAPVVVFSCAIPKQGGSGHINEQWPAYWAERFDRLGYGWVDPYRRRLWNEPDVAYWYAQNMVVYIKRDDPACPEHLLDSISSPGDLPLAFVHPRLFQPLATYARGTLRARLTRFIRRR